ncbi:hypothetical protein [Pseudomonas sp.]|jgi:hypothetical protein|uniref:hypothetical protein n=1 Tax=Pseudomonas sp. TaxID=306 RepID=UPI002ED8E4A5
MSLLDSTLVQAAKSSVSSISGTSMVTAIVGDAFSTVFASQVTAGDKALMGGVSLAKAKQLWQSQYGLSFAKSNLWHLNITNVKTGIAPTVNLFAKGVQTTALSFGAESVEVGATSFAKPGNMAPKEYHVTTFDDLGGSIKGWAANLKLKMAPGDGTYGLPLSYLLRLTLTHGFIGTDAENSGGAHIDNAIVQLISAEYTNARDQDGLQEIELSFRQFDPCTNIV